MKTHSRLEKRLMSPAKEVDWERVFTEQLPRVYNYFRFRVGDDQLAEDLTQSTFEKAWKARSRYQHDLGAFTTWLLTIAGRTLTDYYRKKSKEEPLEAAKFVENNCGVEEAVENRSNARRLAQLLESLEERERELVALKYGAGLTNRDIAQQTGLSESNVGTILYRAVKRLRGEWEADK
jgi:RNA polymerase sigma-70 factor, ECF subfamily